MLKVLRAKIGVSVNDEQYIHFTKQTKEKKTLKFNMKIQWHQITMFTSRNYFSTHNFITPDHFYFIQNLNIFIFHPSTTYKFKSLINFNS